MENFKQLLDLNRVTIVGTVTALDVVDDVNKAGKAIRRGSITVKTPNAEVPLEFYMPEVYNSGKPNQSYVMLGNLAIGGTYRFDCSLTESKFIGNDGTNEIRRSYRIQLNFINNAKDSDTQQAEFEYGGVVVKELTEQVNKEGEVYRYDILIGQKQYNVDRGLNVFRFNVDPRNTAVIDAIRENYQNFDTVKISGIIRTETTTSEKVEEAVFGEAKKTVYQNTNTYFDITGGLTVPSNQVYPKEATEELLRLTKAFDANLATAKQSAPAASKVAKAKPANDPLAMFQ